MNPAAGAHPTSNPKAGSTRGCHPHTQWQPQPPRSASPMPRRGGTNTVTVAELRRVASFLMKNNRHGCAGYLLRRANQLVEAGLDSETP